MEDDGPHIPSGKETRRYSALQELIPLPEVTVSKGSGGMAALPLHQQGAQYRVLALSLLLFMFVFCYAVGSVVWHVASAGMKIVLGCIEADAVESMTQ